MYKLTLSIMLLFLMSGCSSTNNYKTIGINDLSGLEKVVLCEETVEAAQAMADLKNPDLYGTKNKRFYYPAKPVKAFGMQVSFVGYGVMYVNGPNVSVKGSERELKETIEMIIGETSSCKNDICAWKMPKNKSVLVYPHQTDSKMAIVQCAYGLI